MKNSVITSLVTAALVMGGLALSACNKKDDKPANESKPAMKADDKPAEKSEKDKNVPAKAPVEEEKPDVAPETTDELPSDGETGDGDAAEPADDGAMDDTGDMGD